MTVIPETCRAEATFDIYVFIQCFKGNRALEQREPLVEQEVKTLPEHLRSPPVCVIRVVQSSVSCSVCCRSLSCFLDLRFLSDYLFGIFKLSLTFVLEINNEERLKTKFYNKRDDFTFPLINLPFFSSTIFQQHYQMGIIPHNSDVILGLATSTAIFCTELFWWW